MTATTAALAAPAVVVAAGGLWWLFRRPQRVLLVVAGLAPFDGLLLLVPHPRLFEAWKEVLIAGALAVALLPRARNATTPARVPAWAIPVAALVVLAALGLVTGGSRAVIGMKVSFFYALVPVVLWRCPFTVRDRDRLVSVLMATAVITSAVGVAQRVVGAERLVELGYEYDTTVRFAGDQLRAFSTFNQPFPFAFYVVVVALVCVPVALADRGRWRNRLFLAAFPLLMLGVVTSVVRAALLAGAAGAVWLAVRRRRSLVRLVLPGIAGATVVLAGAGGAFVSPDSLLERLDAWRSVAAEVSSSPLGAGIGTSGAAAERAGAELVVGGGATDPAAAGTAGTGGVVAVQTDNYYLKVLIELGPIGLWLFVTVLVLAVGDGRRTAAAVQDRDGPHVDAVLAEGITAATVAAAAAAVVSSYWEIFPVDVLFWLLQGVLLSIRIAEPGWSATRSPCDPAVAASRPTFASSSPASAP